jgi:hypothetical protein
MGGTEVMGALQEAVRTPPPGGRARQVFLITDGEVKQ